MESQETLTYVESPATKPVAPKKRLAWVDFAKFLGIMLVIVGHRAGVRILNMFIFSFHVPAFFVLSGVTFSFSKSYSDFAKKTLKRFIRLVIPYIISLIVVIIVVLIRDNSQWSSRSFWINQTYRIIGYGSATYLSTHALWFLLALFTGSVIFDLLHLACKDNDGLFGILCGLITIVGIIAGTQEILMPLSLDVAMATIIFLFVGYKLKNFDFGKKPLVRNIVLLIIWGATMAIMWFSAKNGTYMAIRNLRFTLFPLCYICAVAGSLLFLQVCFWAGKYLPAFVKPFAFLGRYTLYMVCIHGFGQFVFKYWFAVTDNTHLNNLIYFAVGTAMFAVVLACDLLYHHFKKVNKLKHATNG